MKNLVFYLLDHPAYKELRESDRERIANFANRFDMLCLSRQVQLLSRLSDLALALEPLFTAKEDYAFRMKANTKIETRNRKQRLKPRTRRSPSKSEA